MLKLNTGDPGALVDYKDPGSQPILTDAHRAALAQVIEDGLVPAIHGVVRWRVVDLVQWLAGIGTAQLYRHDRRWPRSRATPPPELTPDTFIVSVRPAWNAGPKGGAERLNE